MENKPILNRFKDDYVQEAMFDAGLNNLRFKLSQELDDRFKVGNISKVMGTNTDKFTITMPTLRVKKIDVISTGSGVKVPGYSQNISLSHAFEVLTELLSSGEITGEKVNCCNTISEGSVIMEPHTNIDISTFGQHSGDDLPNNEYDNEEIEIINKLIASELSATDEYFDCSKNTRDETLRRLYSDIGAEERFHTEQLLYAKSVITGEKYEPRDPDVKKEYQELLAMGMDEETAITTFHDRFGISNITIDDDLDEDMHFIEQAIIQCSNDISILSKICGTTTNIQSNKYLDIITEAYYLEGVDNVFDPGSPNHGHVDPVVLLGRALHTLTRFIYQLITKIKKFIRRERIKKNERNAWIKEHGIKGLFSPGVSMYFYNDKQHGFVSTEPIRYVELMYDLTIELSKHIGLTNLKPLNVPSRNYEKLRFSTITQGLDMVKGVVLTKTKIIVNDANEAALSEVFFGYSPTKVGANNPRSNNVYNSLESMTDVVGAFAKVTEDFVKAANTLSGDPHSAYYTKRRDYEKAMSGFRVVMNGFDTFSKALAHDMNVLVKLNNGMIEQTKIKDDDDAKNHPGYAKEQQDNGNQPVSF